jgi:hypothetical protein
MDVQLTSPAVNAGVNLGSSVVVQHGLQWQPLRDANGQINIGAYEQ